MLRNLGASYEGAMLAYPRLLPAHPPPLPKSGLLQRRAPPPPPPAPRARMSGCSLPSVPTSPALRAFEAAPRLPLRPVRSSAQYALRLAFRTAPQVAALSLLHALFSALLETLRSTAVNPRACSVSNHWLWLGISPENFRRSCGEGAVGRSY